MKHMIGGFATLLWIGAFLCFGAFIIENSREEDPLKDNLYLGKFEISIFDQNFD